jgi:hypothetical protein
VSVHERLLAPVVSAVLLLGACGSSDDSSGTSPADGSEGSSTTESGSAELAGDLPAGTATYAVRLPDEGAARFTMTVTLPEGWAGEDGWVLRTGGGVEERTGIAISLWGAPAFVYRDPCRWADSAVTVEATVDFVAGLLAEQTGRSAFTPRALEVGGHRAVELRLSVPDDIDLASCDEYEGEPYFQSWASADGSTARYHQGPGQRDLVRIIDVDGTLLIVDVATWPELPAEADEEIMAILDSMRFEVDEA